MAIRDRFSDELPTVDDSLTEVFLALTVMPTALGAAHHIGHVIRGNHVGWPLTSEVNPFTYSLAIYPLLATGLYQCRLTENYPCRSRSHAKRAIGRAISCNCDIGSSHAAVQPPRKAVLFGTRTALCASAER